MGRRDSHLHKFNESQQRILPGNIWISESNFEWDLSFILERLKSWKHLRNPADNETNFILMDRQMNFDIN